MTYLLPPPTAPAALLPTPRQPMLIAAVSRSTLRRIRSGLVRAITILLASMKSLLRSNANAPKSIDDPNGRRGAWRERPQFESPYKVRGVA